MLMGMSIFSLYGWLLQRLALPPSISSSMETYRQRTSPKGYFQTESTDAGRSSHSVRRPVCPTLARYQMRIPILEALRSFRDTSATSF
jgi:hypothetical protein